MDSDLREIVDLFIQSLPGRIDILEQGRATLTTDATEFESIRICLHNLAGISGSLGFDDLTIKSRAIELKIMKSKRDGNFFPDHAVLSSLDSELSEVVDIANNIIKNSVNSTGSSSDEVGN